MDSLIQDLWKKMTVGVVNTEDNTNSVPNNNTNTNPNSKKEEEEEKKGPSVYDDEKPKKEKKISFLEAYEKKEVKLPECPNITVEEIAKKIKVTSKDDLLDITTILQILQNSMEVTRKPYVQMIFDNRKERRKMFFLDKKKYNTKVLTLLKETENMMNQASEDLLVALNITKEVFENSLMVLMESGYEQQIFMTQASIFQRLREFLGSNKTISKDEIKEVFKYQLLIFTQKDEEFKDLIDSLKENPETTQMIPVGINVIVSDLLYDKFEIEEEDTMNVMKDPTAFMSDPEMFSLMMACEDALQNIMVKTGLVGGMPEFV